MIQQSRMADESRNEPDHAFDRLEEEVEPVGSVQTVDNVTR